MTWRTKFRSATLALAVGVAAVRPIGVFAQAHTTGEYSGYWYAQQGITNLRTHLGLRIDPSTGWMEIDQYVLGSARTSYRRKLEKNHFTIRLVDVDSFASSDAGYVCVIDWSDPMKIPCAGLGFRAGERFLLVHCSCPTCRLRCP